MQWSEVEARWKEEAVDGSEMPSEQERTNFSYSLSSLPNC
jgi:hypothetical protein